MNYDDVLLQSIVSDKADGVCPFSSIKKELQGLKDEITGLFAERKALYGELELEDSIKLLEKEKNCLVEDINLLSTSLEQIRQQKADELSKLKSDYSEKYALGQQLIQGKNKIIVVKEKEIDYLSEQIDRANKQLEKTTTLIKQKQEEAELIKVELNKDIDSKNNQLNQREIEIVAKTKVIGKDIEEVSAREAELKRNSADFEKKKTDFNIQSKNELRTIETRQKQLSDIDKTITGNIKLLKVREDQLIENKEVVEDQQEVLRKTQIHFEEREKKLYQREKDLETNWSVFIKERAKHGKS